MSDRKGDKMSGIDIISYKLGQKSAGGGSGGGSVRLQNKTFNANGTYKADAGYDGLGTVTVDVAGSGGIAAGISYDEISDNGYLLKATVYGDVLMAYAFNEASTLTEVNLPNSITKIPDYAFQRCTNLAPTELPASLQTIGNYAFYTCSMLALTELPTSLQKIGNYAFQGTKLALTELPANVAKVSEGVFRSCSNLAITEIPASVTHIYRYAFSGCSSLRNITFKGTPAYIDSNAFQSCTFLETINVPWAEGAVANAPWGATNATINYNYTGA